MDWSAFSEVGQLLIQYYFGSPMVFYTSMILLFILFITAAGLDIRLSLVFSLPLIGAFAANGVFGVYGWITNLALIIIAIIYSYALLKIFT